jgi:hypothetical protein
MLFLVDEKKKDFFSVFNKTFPSLSLSLCVYMEPQVVGIRTNQKSPSFYPNTYKQRVSIHDKTKETQTIVVSVLSVLLILSVCTIIGLSFIYCRSSTQVHKIVEKPLIKEEK